MKKAVKKQQGSVYVCRADNGLVKIGRSANWKQRLHDLSSVLPYALEVVYIFQCAVDVENYLHRVFRDRRIQGEWFDLPNSLIQSIPDHVLAADSESGREVSSRDALRMTSLPSWVMDGMKRAEAKGILDLFSVVVYADGCAIQFDLEAKLKALLALSRRCGISKQQVHQALSDAL